MQSIINLEQAILENIRQLTPEKQQEVLDFAEFLRQKTAVRKKRRSLRGLCEDLSIHISEEEITEARREMWSNSLRELPE